MTKIDFKRNLKHLYAPTTKAFVEVVVPPMTFVKVDGAGDPNTVEAYAQALQSLYSISFGMKFAAKTLLGQDYVVPPLEGLWWADDPADFTTRNKDQWNWTMMIMVPDFVRPKMFEDALERTECRVGTLPSSLRLESYDEGRSLHILHIGSYDDEAPTLARLHEEIMPDLGVTFHGPHHEIYLSDPRRTEASRLKTILRQPVKPVENAW
ncbi:GyrI-like domain-containing protein [Sulfitobacter sp. F26204]|uniref:GyrI-like domain-containing protein n=1 Tax=Sulfitobacter sp. F26204 TaxID=2996014 RepID=UPI00225DE3AE|nr:GyrI-like domain-containing protein [Sulfitobacter sp. F26204]MCX7559832.1 GyrI-like domain-containing protein [Sulfitobacter sp. F26204]